MPFEVPDFERKKNIVLFCFAENGARVVGAGATFFSKSEISNDIFWLRNEETNSIFTNLEEIKANCHRF